MGIEMMNISLQSLVIVLVSHWTGDYLLQGNDMAAYKSTRLNWLALHVLVYSLVLLGFSMLIFSWVVAIKYAVANGLLHFVTDLFTSRLAANYRQTPRIYYPIIGFDQLVHALALAMTLYYFNGS